MTDHVARLLGGTAVAASACLVGGLIAMLWAASPWIFVGFAVVVMVGYLVGWGLGL